MSIVQNLIRVKSSLPEGVTLCAVSKYFPSKDIQTLYDVGHRVFGESRPQELVAKAAKLPKDIEWRFIGHLQTNKVNLVVPIAEVIESVDSLRLLNAISKQAVRNNKTVKVLLQMHIAREQSKQGFEQSEIEQILQGDGFSNVEIVGLMGMATYCDDMSVIREEFMVLKGVFDRYPTLRVLSMGMSGDYGVAVECGSTSIRVGSLIFGDGEWL